MAPRRGKINPADVICGHLRQVKAAVTDALQSARVGTDQIQSAAPGV